MDPLIRTFADRADAGRQLAAALGHRNGGRGEGDVRIVNRAEVAACLERARSREPARVAQPGPIDPPLIDDEAEISAGGVRLAGHLTVPEEPLGVAVFAHGSGSSRQGPRNRYVAGVLNSARLGTLLFDLLTGEEELALAGRSAPRCATLACCATTGGLCPGARSQPAGSSGPGSERP